MCATPNNQPDHTMKNLEPDDTSSVTAASILERRGVMGFAQYFDKLLVNWKANQYHLSMATSVLLNALHVGRTKLGATPAGMSRELANFATADHRVIVSIINQTPTESGNHVAALLGALRLYEMAGVRWSVRHQPPATEQWTPPPRIQAAEPKPAAPAPVVVHVHNHLPKINKSVATVERDKNGDMTRTVTRHEYAETTEKETTA